MTPDAVVFAGRVIEKAYGRTVALRGVSLDVRAGEVVGFAGPNGSGKSTLGRILLGFARPSKGEATICGVPSARYRREHGVGFEPESATRAWAGVTVRELLWLRGDPESLGGNAELLSVLGVVRHLDRRIGTLSKGEWRIVLSAYAMLGVPRAIVLDEPDAGLDPAVMGRLRDAVAFCASRGAALLVFSHHLDEMALMADRLLFIRAGALSGEFLKTEFDASSLRRLYAERVGDT